MFNTLRCSLCDRTNNNDVENLPGGLSCMDVSHTGRRRNKATYFYPDPSDPDKMLCIHCYESIKETKEDFDYLGE